MCVENIPDSDIDKLTKIYLHETLFLARKIIARQRMRPLPPRINDWMIDKNNTLPYLKNIYINRGCSAKYNKIWDCWLQAAENCI